MTAVSDASPLNFLVRIEQLELLPSLFTSVTVPEAVATELSHARTPAPVRNVIHSPPKWLAIRSPTQPVLSLGLGPGETQAITLALELQPRFLFIDESKGRRIAQSQGIRVIGTLGILELAHRTGLANLAHTLPKLLATDFLIHPSLVSQLLRRNGLVP